MPRTAPPPRTRKALIDHANETLARACRASASGLRVEILPDAGWAKRSGKRRCIASVQGVLTAAEMRSIADLMDAVDAEEG